MKTERVTFAGPLGQQLAGVLDHPPGPARAIALFAHCFSCGKDLRSVRRVAAQLLDRGIAVLRFDFTGLGASEGDFADTNFSSNVDDLVAAADWLRQTWGPPALLVGHSLGGAAALVASSRIPELRAVATIGAPADPAHLEHLLDSSIEEIETNGEAQITIAGRPFTIRQQFLADIEQANLEPVLRGLQLPYLIMHAPEDEIVSIDNADILFSHAARPKSFISLDGADHLLSDPDHAERAGSLLASWAEQYLLANISGSDDVIVAAAEGEVVVAERGTGDFAQVIRVAERHALLADEPKSLGGDDTGPDPYDLLLASLGACTSMTVRMYANRKGWSVDDIAVRLSHDRIHADDCAACESETGKVDVIETELVITGDLDAEQRARLLEIADRCPVHRTLHNEIHITTELAEA